MKPFMVLFAFCALFASRAASSTNLFQPCSFNNFDQAIEHFSTAITFKTISITTQHAAHMEEFQALKRWLPTAYPEVWQKLKVEEVGSDGLSLLLTWPGSDASLKPVLFISHTDVVPVSEDTVPDWTHPPFSGAVADGYVWGRGTLDVKVGVIGLLEAATALLQEGYKPRRTLMLAFGHDEEVGGMNGAAATASLLQSRGVSLDMVWDEGGSIVIGALGPRFSQPFALIGTSEKSYQTITVTMHAKGGHSSMPAAGRSRIATRLGRLLVAIGSNPPPPKLVPPTLEFVTGFAQMAPKLTKPLLLAVKDCRPCAWLVARMMAKMDNTVAALVRTTAAVTSIAAGVADNVLPQTGRVKINFRLLPGDTPQTALQHIQQWLGKDAQHATISMNTDSFHRVPVTDSTGPHFGLLKAAVQQVWKLRDGMDGSSSSSRSNGHETAATAAASAERLAAAAAAMSRSQPATGQSIAVLPYLMMAGSDSKHYTNLTSNILRFNPYSLDFRCKDIQRIHGTDERLALEDFGRLLCTYKAGMQLAGLRGDTDNVAAAAAAGSAAGSAAADTASACGAAGADGEVVAGHDHMHRESATTSSSRDEL